MELVPRPKMRGVLLLDVDSVFDESHPLWRTVMAFVPLTEELHVIALSKSLPLGYQSIARKESLIIYHFKRDWFVFRFFDIWHTLRFNLVWRNTFRGDFILSFGGGKSAVLAALMRVRFKCKFFLTLSSHSLGLRARSLRYWLLDYALHYATCVIVPGAETAKAYTKHFGVPPAVLTALPPAVDSLTLTETRSGYNFHIDHAQYNFFILSILYDRADLMKIFSIHEHVTVKYPRAAFVILTPESQKKHFEHIISHTKHYGVFVYTLDDNYLSFIKGAHIYLGIGLIEDVDKGILSALGSGVPVIATARGIAPELFAGSAFTEFQVAHASADLIAPHIIRLLENQQLRTQYALNTNLLFSKMKFITPDDYAKALYDLISQMVQPVLIDPMAALNKSENTRANGGRLTLFWKYVK